MDPETNKIGRIYNTLSLAVVPVVLASVAVYLATFKQHGPHVQGLPALMVIFAVIIGVLGINTLAATLLAVLVVETRPRKKSLLWAMLGFAVLAVLYFLILFTK